MKSQNHSLINNPLRISQEALDLDDIISDLNESAPSTATKQHPSTTKPDKINKEIESKY